mmetsp:Transcript_22239/g.30595  ORF Transcript_22239/g.30595 Transcript_22239/m.30595 type:complete len:558 (-) Transcript_22239:315-1988(-)
MKAQMATIQHGSYLCPGLHDAGSRMDVTIRYFSSLLGPESPRIFIPLFQRTYCWEEQIAGWWRDVQIATPEREHRVGKIILKQSPEERDCGSLICIDGQQRITTQLLFLSALRDAAFVILQEIDEKLLSLSPTAGSLLSNCQEFIRGLDGFLYRDVNKCEEWIQQRAQQQQEEEGQEDQGGFYRLGERLDFMTLLPSFCDRVPFYELILAAKIYNELHYNKRGGGGGGASSSSSSTSPSTYSFSQYAKSTRMGKAKLYFDSKVRQYARLSKPFSSGENGEKEGMLQESLRSLQRISKQALDGMSCARIEILTPINFSQVFLWFQEKSLFSLGALLHNPSPGEKFKPSDLVRNLILSGFMHLSLEQQERLYRQWWLEPLEFHFDPPTFERLLTSFLSDRENKSQSEGQDGDCEMNDADITAGGEEESSHRKRKREVKKEPRFIGSFESYVLKIKDTGFKAAEPETYEDPLKYGRFHSYFQTKENYLKGLPLSERLKMTSATFRIKLENEASSQSPAAAEKIQRSEEQAISTEASFLALEELADFAKTFVDTADHPVIE